LYVGGQDSATNRPLVRRYDFSTNDYTTLLNLGTIPGVPVNPGTYAGFLSSSARSPEKIAVMFGATQDLHPYVAVFTPGTSAPQPIVVNTRDSTITANGVTSATNITLGFTMHHANIDKSGRYVLLGPQGDDVNRGVAPKFVWDLSNNVITAMPKSSLAQGHDSAGFGTLVNGDCCVSTEWDGAQWQLRSLATPLSSSDLIVPTLTPHEGGGAPNGQPNLAEHTSWNNAQDGTLVPVLAELYRWGGATNPWRAWDDEIVAIQTTGQTKVWRFAHHRTDTTWDDDPTHSEFEYQPKVNISQNGRWAIFNSNWEKTLGVDAHPPAVPHVTKRRDVFVLELASR
jgi:hypothetical protein